MDLSSPILLVFGVVLAVGLAFIGGLAGVRAFIRFREERAHFADVSDNPPPSDEAPGAVQQHSPDPAGPQPTPPEAPPAQLSTPNDDALFARDTTQETGHPADEEERDEVTPEAPDEPAPAPVWESVGFERVTGPVIAVRIVPEEALPVQELRPEAEEESRPEPEESPAPIVEDYLRLAAETAPSGTGSYLDFFGLEEDPFAVTPDLRYWVATKMHRDALAKLFHGVQSQKGCVALTGPPGTGKTFVLEHLTAKLKDSGIDFALIVNPRLTVEEFYEAVALDLGLEGGDAGKVRRLMAIQERAIRAAEEGTTMALVIDNAHRLEPAVLEEIDLLGNVESRRAKLLQIVLSGQPELNAKLDEAGLSSLRQRIASHVRLRSLTGEQAARYLRERLEIAGAPELFPLGAMQAIIGAARGVPRQMNLLASATLERAHGMGERTPTAELVEEAARELGYDSGVLRSERNRQG